MSLNSVVSAERVHIGFFGLRNAGKSSVVNAVTGQSLSLVSDIKGTTTDPVKKAMELLPLGPVVIIDTPGIDDEGTLGEMRVKRAKQILNQTDIAVLVVDGEKGLQTADEELISLFDGKAIPYIIAYNKSDLLNSVPEADENSIYVSAENGTNIYELKEMIARKAKTCESEKKLVADLISANDLVVLVVPIDSAAPKGRLILPQQQVIRDVLESGACAVVCRETELKDTLAALGRKPRLVITDSQAFGKVSADTPADIPLTSFSILFVRYKSDLTAAVRGAAQLDKLKDGDRVLISEGCTHHRQCEDIGTVKMPAWVRGYTGKNIEFDFTSGTEFPEDLSRYSLVIHCGACMLNPREMQSRARHAKDCGVPMTNYGVAIAQMHSILRRSIELFPEALKELDG
ncbi:MAG: [FeFe] hydrogenase H-cluster maturation GTPase HydF [Oscillospiraceae bacterium]|nr:[FeFe] hydrogenase H-cluster maturation GTPase HydF [Oscillospiraceae bacterium]